MKLQYSMRQKAAFINTNNFTWLARLTTKYLMRDVCFIIWLSALFATILNYLTINIFQDYNIFCHKPIPNNANFTLMWKKNSKKYFDSFKEIPVI